MKLKYTTDRPTEASEYYWFRSVHGIEQVVQVGYLHGCLRCFWGGEWTDINNMGGEFAGPIPRPEG